MGRYVSTYLYDVCVRTLAFPYWCFVIALLKFRYVVIHIFYWNCHSTECWIQAIFSQNWKVYSTLNFIIKKFWLFYCDCTWFIKIKIKFKNWYVAYVFRKKTCTNAVRKSLTYMVSFTEHITEFQQALLCVLSLPNITPHMLVTVQILDSFHWSTTMLAIS